jgi:hypothetical protein
MTSLVGSILAILACGGIGGVAAWLVVTTFDWTGTAGAIVAAAIGMAIAFAVFAAGAAVLQALRGRA